MLRQFLSQLELHRLPLVSMGIFLVIFLVVLVRVLRRARGATYRQIASLPLDDGQIVENRNEHR
jgi:hypothetical protein